MNCEKCKNKKATVFYADDTGSRHSLCALCAVSMGKIAQYDPESEDKKPTSQFIPEPSLYSLCAKKPSFAIYSGASESDLSMSCPYCSTQLETIISKGTVGCPECYTAFSCFLFPASLTPESAKGARMPSSRRASIDRVRAINDLRSRIRIAVETENYELAASLRDEIRKLESQKRA